jgi:diacylglycerol O-acyltransferase
MSTAVGTAAGPLPPPRLSGEDLTFWWVDRPMQPTTMTLLLVLDRMPDWARLRRAVERAIVAVPRLRQRVVEAPLDLTVPHWALDPTFGLDYHLRRHALGGTHDMDELFREIAPAYETPFDRSRPPREARVYEGLAGGGAAIFFKLHHAVADGVGGNAIFAAMTDGEREVTFGAVAFTVTNVPGILATRYLAGAEITAAYPFAPVAVQSPASIALYGYRDRLFIGIDADETVMPDVEGFERVILDGFDELRAGAGQA